MLPILTLTPNPALDLATSAPEVRPGPKLRCAPPRSDPGGGGVNVSRAIRLLGGDSLALVATGGDTGRRLAALIAAEGLRLERLEVAGETRWSLAVTDTGTGGQYRFVLPGPDWEAADLAGFEALVRRHLEPGALVVLSGSLPPGVPPDWPAALAGLVGAAGARLIADTSGAPLRHLAAAGAGLFLLRMDGAEAEGLAGRPLPQAADTAGFAAGLVATGAAQAVIVARGAEGSVLATAEGCRIAACPVAEVVSAVGAGDSFVAGLALALARGGDLDAALACGTAAAAAAVLTEATALCRREDAERLLASVRAAPLSLPGA
jgi:6-phosphofructokinase 2